MAATLQSLRWLLESELGKCDIVGYRSQWLGAMADWFLNVCLALSVALGVFFLPVAMKTARSADRAVDFQQNIAPIFAAACSECHSGKESQGELRLDSRDAALKGGFSGPGIVAGSAEKSEIYQRITSSDPDLRMPYQREPLSPEKIALIRTWLDQGADWPDSAAGTEPATSHWAYIKPRRPAEPSVSTAGWVRNPIDSFVLARLEQEGMSPSPAAAKEQLIRRVSLDLTGLPPTLAEVDQFLGDDDPSAYERIVDRLLASPRYGERWAQPWLDSARYADSNGFTNDRARTIWPYRDWVVRAYNDDMPFDRFTIEQLAGDLLPNASESQLVATGFQRNTMFNDEQGVDQMEARFHAMVDRVGTTATVWLGTTLACAECHNHKYDPFSQKDFYGLLAFFDNADFAWEGTAYNRKYIEPTFDLAPPDVRARRQALENEVTRLQDKLREAERTAKQNNEDKQKNNGWTSIRAQIDAKKREVAEATKSYPQTLVVYEKKSSSPLTANVRVKGAFRSQGELVEAGVPRALPSLPTDAPHNRLGLARWLIDPQNPLTARVIVNRYWGQFFGRGLVETEEDFGRRGSLPTHPELLDWLATEFMRCNWSTKQIHKLIVMSATYRQSSRISGEAMERDPHNELLARGPRNRLNAEFVRDVTLAISGLLSPKVGGPPVFPPQPELSALTDHGDFHWIESRGEDRYRRGLYTFWRRSALYPALMNFDAPSREACTIRRGRSNTPLQALTLLNDVTAAEAAAALAKRIQSLSVSDDVGQRASFGFRLCTCRLPNSSELNAIVKSYENCRTAFEREKNAAVKIADGAHIDDDKIEFAAWFLVSQALLNLDETLSRE